MCQSERPRIEFNITEEEAAEIERRRKICKEVENHLVSVFQRLRPVIDRLDDSDLDKVQRLVQEMEQVTVRARTPIYYGDFEPRKFQVPLNLNLQPIPNFLLINIVQGSGDVTVTCCLRGRFDGKDVYESNTGTMFFHNVADGRIEYIEDDDLYRELDAGREEVAKLKGVLAAKVQC